jgi:UTP--glucose-1-phosphate uridylyltransferase
MRSNNVKNKKVKTAIIAAGGYGTRFLPFTRVVPKELLPLGDTPMIELLVRECISAGIKDIFIIVRSDSDIIKKHFSSNIKYEKYLLKTGKKDYLKKISCHSYKSSAIYFVEEDEKLPYGNARGLFAIKDRLMKENCFLLLFGDDIVLNGESSIAGLIKKYINNDCEAVIGVQKVPIAEVPKYGNIKLKAGTSDQLEVLIQKPKPSKIVSNLVIYSQLVLTPEIFKYLDPNQKSNETDVGVALNKLAKNKKVLLYKAQGTWVTIGDPINYIKANLFRMISDHSINKNEVIKYLKSIKN